VRCIWKQDTSAEYTGAARVSTIGALDVSVLPRSLHLLANGPPPDSAVHSIDHFAPGEAAARRLFNQMSGGEHERRRWAPFRLVGGQPVGQAQRGRLLARHLANVLSSAR
jgi:hypothetical protein